MSLSTLRRCVAGAVMRIPVFRVSGITANMLAHSACIKASRWPHFWNSRDQSLCMPLTRLAATRLGTLSPHCGERVGRSEATGRGEGLVSACEFLLQ